MSREPTTPPRGALPEIAFHLRELVADVRRAREAARKLLADERLDANLDRTRAGLIDVVYALEHDLEHHLPAGLALLRELLSLPPPASQPPEPHVPGAEGEPTAALVDERLRDAVAALEKAGRRLDEATALGGASHDAFERQRELLEDVKAALSRAAARARSALDEVGRLWRAAHPAAAAQADRDEEVATPLQTRRHPDARRFSRCPACGAALGDGDRTFTGSYCEACRTRWDEGDEG